MNKYKVAILMATFNGVVWLPAQLRSILNQRDVEVSIYVSDDLSQDGGFGYLQQLSLQEARLHLLPQAVKFGSAGKNFYRLIQDVDVTDYDYIAYADQDDIWEQDKLIRHISLMQKCGVDGVSSNVLAFWSDGQKKLINKSQPQRELDYLFESAGPGCTFLMSPWLINELKRLLHSGSSIAREVALHDWLAYAVCRASGRKWLIDPTPSVQYRQHTHNVIGANSGIKAKLARIRNMSWYRQEVMKVVQVCTEVSDIQRLKHMSDYLTTSGVKSRLGLLSFVFDARRAVADRLFLAFSILIGLF